MLINNRQDTLALNNMRKIKEKNISSDEFQATLNALKNKEEKEYKKETNENFNNADLNIKDISKDFSVYAWENSTKANKSKKYYQ